jgi:hypothetical protein
MPFFLHYDLSHCLAELLQHAKFLKQQLFIVCFHDVARALCIVIVCKQISGKFCGHNSG